MYQHPTTGAKLIMGTAAFAANREQLRETNISCIVNCQSKSSANVHQNDPELDYFRFPIAFWQRNAADGANVAKFLMPLFEYIDSQLGEGKNILVHCLAGAHRAGTAGKSEPIHHQLIC